MSFRLVELETGRALAVVRSHRVVAKAKSQAFTLFVHLGASVQAQAFVNVYEYIQSPKFTKTSSIQPETELTCTLVDPWHKLESWQTLATVVSDRVHARSGLVAEKHVGIVLECTFVNVNASRSVAYEARQTFAKERAESIVAFGVSVAFVRLAFVDIWKETIQ